MLSRYQNAAAASREYAERFPERHGEINRTGLKILENNKNIQSIISVNTNILLRRFRLKFLRIMYSTSCYKELLKFENTLYKEITKVSSLRYLKLRRNCRESKGIKSKRTKNHTVSCVKIE
jgi:hypothetical protein